MYRNCVQLAYFDLRRVGFLLATVGVFFVRCKSLLDGRNLFLCLGYFLAEVESVVELLVELPELVVDSLKVLPLGVVSLLEMDFGKLHLLIARILLLLEAHIDRQILFYFKSSKKIAFVRDLLEK